MVEYNNKLELNQSKLTQLWSWDTAGLLLVDDGMAAALTTQHKIYINTSYDRHIRQTTSLLEAKSLMTPHQGLCHWIKLGAPPLDPSYSLMFHAYHGPPPPVSSMHGLWQKISTLGKSDRHVHCTGWANKNRTFLNVDNFATVSGRKACDMSKVC